ncbi:MAG: twin arginine-targeting protein translocase TatB [Caulobacterales bacterium GWE1_67_11]|jgi:sec-independent protein translocase protein TatB|uniref:Sec-independent protein translocase protein TatB n=1 Tax=Brevundimonas sp. EAKA TaxID=1495854 RepID=UPI00055934AC|nr:Sec-independent protein translocase protein TatB [Brevundimonas sp. EAKA]OGN47016.1 MAG: twin arginine-targeting protein translocase TatB [Caulobacterales bacterium GWE1_67_11]OGN48732.1 MAG: twin arginine-targeting protein translocase TatB [Caulobacterales bacterium RIFCSPHIGHO2_01_FULL_67_30]
MGGLGPGIGGFELVVIGLVALLVVGPKDLPVLMRRVGQMVAKARAMANEFRSSFDEMARQSELDDLRKEVEALRSGQGAMYPLGADADAAFKDINAGLTGPGAPAALPAPTAEAPIMTPAADEWPDAPPLVEPTPTIESKTKRATAKTAAKSAVSATAETKPKPRPKAKPKAASTATIPATKTPAKPRTPRKKAVEL